MAKREDAAKARAAALRDTRADIIPALQAERAGYVRRGWDKRVAEVDKQIAAYEKLGDDDGEKAVEAPAGHAVTPTGEVVKTSDPVQTTGQAVTGEGEVVETKLTEATGEAVTPEGEVVKTEADEPTTSETRPRRGRGSARAKAEEATKAEEQPAGE